MKKEPQKTVFEPQTGGEKNPMLRLYLPLAILVVIAVGSFILVNLDRSKTKEKIDNGEKTDNLSYFGNWNFDLVKDSFAKAINNNESTITPAVPYAKVQVSEIENLKSFETDGGIVLTAAQKAALEDTGFFLAENNIVGEEPSTDDFTDMYNNFGGSSGMYYREGDDAVFITSDTMLHLYHILIDRSFQKIEEEKFQPQLRTMTEALFKDSINNYNNATDEKIKDSYKRLSAYYLIPLVVLDAGDNTDSKILKPEDFDTYAQFVEAQEKQAESIGSSELAFSLDQKNYDGEELADEIYDLAKAELELIQKAEGKTASPLFTPLRPELENDYSQFKPRSHYTKNSILRSYFISMMWYGRMGFPLASPELTRDALIITAQINNLEAGGQKISDTWSNMATVIDFFVGEVDDLTAFQYTPVIKEIYGENISANVFANNQFLNDFIARAKAELPAPKIVSEAVAVYDDGGQRDELLNNLKQFRFMGQRFTPDAYIINNLTQGAGTPDPETGQMLPTMPTALEIMNVLAPDNSVVKDYLDQWINDPKRIKEQARESDKIIPKVLDSLKKEFASYDIADWSQNIYWRWLDIFKTLLADYGSGYPSFMQTEAWQKKNLGNVLGSFTELKHDTLLYAKQSYAEMGGGGELPELPPIVKGYVEPDIEFWNQIIDLATITRDGLKSRNVFPEDFDYKYQAFIETSQFFKKLAEQELNNETISDDDFEKLRTIDSSLMSIAEPLPGQILTKKEKRAGIIADIHTDALHEQILYEATGKPYIIYVAVKDANGTRLTRGATFNHYEFADELKERLSDEDWQEKIYDNSGVLPSADEWSEDLVK